MCHFHKCPVNANNCENRSWCVLWPFPCVCGSNCYFLVVEVERRKLIFSHNHFHVHFPWFPHWKFIRNCCDSTCSPLHLRNTCSMGTYPMLGFSYFRCLFERAFCPLGSVYPCPTCQVLEGGPNPQESKSSRQATSQLVVDRPLVPAKTEVLFNRAVPLANWHDADYF